PTTNARTLLEQYGDLEKEELESQNIQVSVAGRLMLDRKSFKVLQDQSGRIQIYATHDVQKDTRLWDIGDIVGVTGQLCKSGKSDLYVMIEEYQLHTKSLRPLPEKNHGRTETEPRYRMRYVELVMNEESLNSYITRTKIVLGIRQFMVA